MAPKLDRNMKLCGGISILVLVTTAILCGLIGLFGCSTVKFPTVGGGQLDAGLFRYKTKAFYYVQGSDEVWYTDTCASYDYLNDGGFSYELDKKAETMQGLAISVGVIGGVFAIISCVIPCVPNCSNKFWLFTGLIFVLTGIMQGCTLMLLDSSICTDNPVVQYFQRDVPGNLEVLDNPTKCEKSSGYKLIISATAFWIVAGFMMMLFPAPTCFPGEDEDEVVVTDQHATDAGKPEAGAADVEVPDDTHKDDEER